MIARLCALLSLLALAWVCGNLGDSGTSHDWTHGYTACVSEDSPGPCFWDAAQRGNGLGHSFLVTPDQKVIVVTER